MFNFRTIYSVFIVLIPTLLFSQTTISQNDYYVFFTVGNTGMFASKIDPVTIDILEPGGNRQWNFEGIVADNIDETNYISPTGTPFATTFPNADVAGYISFMQEEGGVTTTGESWNYFSTNDAAILGIGSIFTDNSTGSDITTTSTKTHIPPFNELNFPLNFGDSWMKSDSSETVAESSLGTFTTSLRVDYEVSIDAWGTMTMPSGKVVNGVLRTREVVNTTSYFFGMVMKLLALKNWKHCQQNFL